MLTVLKIFLNMAFSSLLVCFCRLQEIPVGGSRNQIRICAEPSLGSRRVSSNDRVLGPSQYLMTKSKRKVVYIPVSELQGFSSRK